jgi:hypothetical protein
MAKPNKSQKVGITVEPREFKNLIGLLNSIPKESQNEIRDLAQPLSKDLAQALSVAAAFSAAPPQAILVARSITTPRDRLIRVDIGGSKKVGRSYGGIRTESRTAAPAGQLLWGSEHGSTGAPTDRYGRKMGRRFVKPFNKNGYWIAPTVDANIRRVADAYTDALKALIKRLGLD